ncbi:hypothetical protein ACIRVF_08180 [Kitasatospora sp. NPDC101157]|uniref:hypothetical protein n=1 Tax=Kitasatospora sp. NPDC101157 TaxID=3364098 RepID=UPI0037FE4D1E
MTTTPPDDTADPIGWTAAMNLVRTAAALMAAWSLYVVARHYDVPMLLAIAAGLVYDGVAYVCLKLATDAVRDDRSAAAPVLATLGMVATSIYLNVVHARFTGGGRPAEVLYASPAVAFLIVSALSWAAERAACRTARGETPMRMPAYGFLGWTLAGGKAYRALKNQAVSHVTSGASVPHPPASAVERKDHRALLREKFSKMDPADAVEIAAASHPDMSHAEIAEMLAVYGITVSTLDVALILGEAAVPTITLNRVPQPPVAPAPAIGAQMRPNTAPNAPQVKGMTKADAITTMATHLGGLDTPAKAIATALAQQGRPADTAYIRHRLSLEKKKAAKAAAEAKKKAAEATAQTEQQRAEYERRHGNGGYA